MYLRFERTYCLHLQDTIKTETAGFFETLSPIYVPDGHNIMHSQVCGNLASYLIEVLKLILQAT
jgi:hypothetical protein